MHENSAEQEAEQILKEAYAEARADECPEGDQCSVHFRVDEAFFEEKGKRQYARLITYVGEYCVLTTDNSRYEDPRVVLGILYGMIKKEELPPRWETMIFHVGSGVLGDLEGTPLGVLATALRYSQEHDVWENVEGEHTSTVMMLNAGLIDASKPWSGD